ncbi:MAG: hypothetical protein DRO14_02555 [Thermoprotei archaeon]|nr:MAG: hypothetical protein DRO14_02555 [Thermoprotei archaeon]
MINVRVSFRVLALLAIVAVLTSGLYYIHAYTVMRSGKEIIVGVELNDHSAAFWVALDNGYFEELGLNIEYMTFSTGLELAVALSRGDFDIALACVGPVMVMYSRGVPVVLVAMTHLHGYSMVVNENISDIEELSGAKATVSGPGSPVWLLAHMVMDEYNVSFDLVKMPPFVAVNALLNHQVRASFLPEHYATLAVRLGGYRVVTSQELWRGMPGSGIFVRKDFLINHRDIVKKFVYAIYRAINFIKENPDKAAVIVAKHLASSVDIMSESMKYLDYSVKVNRTAIQQYADLLHRYGAIDHVIDVDEFVELSILRDLGLIQQ